jgi:hypothetical protein
MGDVPDYFLLPMESSWPELQHPYSRNHLSSGSRKEVTQEPILGLRVATPAL